MCPRPCAHTLCLNPEMDTDTLESLDISSDRGEKQHGPWLPVSPSRRPPGLQEGAGVLARRFDRLRKLCD